MIKMPDGVPPEVSNSFIALIPGAVILFIILGYSPRNWF